MRSFESEWDQRIAGSRSDGWDWRAGTSAKVLCSFLASVSFTCDSLENKSLTDSVILDAILMRSAVYRNDIHMFACGFVTNRKTEIEETERQIYDKIMRGNIAIEVDSIERS